MHNRPSIAIGPSRPIALELNGIWDVDADASYHVERQHPERGLVAVRTRAGEGSVQLAGKAPLSLEVNTLILIEQERLTGYRCAAERWQFWWFVFETTDPLPCAPGTVFPVKGETTDAADFNKIFAKLQSPSYASRCVASSLFSVLLHQWLAEASVTRNTSPHRRVIDTMIERMHADIAADWSLPRLSDESGMCESLFRREFRRATGKPPARFIHEARLQNALQLIRQKVYTLAAVAEMTGFSSAFHLSAAFKKQFGMPPSLAGDR